MEKVGLEKGCSEPEMPELSMRHLPGMPCFWGDQKEKATEGQRLGTGTTERALTPSSEQNLPGPAFSMLGLSLD